MLSFHVKFVQTDGRAMVKQYAPDLSIRGHKKFNKTKTPFWCVWERSLFKTLWEKEKLLVTSIFSFSHNVFYSIKDRNDRLCSFILSSANAFNSDKDQIMLSGNGLILNQTISYCNNRCIVWCSMPLSTVFQLYRCSQFTYP